MSARKNSNLCHTGRRVRSGIFFWSAALSIFLSLAGILYGNSRPGEYDVKAVYLLNFGKFVTWPGQGDKQADSTFPVCVLGQDPFGHALDNTLTGEKLAGLNVVARRIEKPQEAIGCRILFISRPESSHPGAILEALRDAPVLTVGDSPDFARRGGMIQFVLQGDRVRFTVNLNAASRAGLKLSSQLLKVASSVIGKPAGGDDR